MIQHTYLVPFLEINDKISLFIVFQVKMENYIKEEYEIEDTKKSIELIDTDIQYQISDIDCDICGKTLANRAVLEKHVLLVHFNAKLPNTKDIKTIKKRDGVFRHFEKFLQKKKQEPLEKLLTDPEKLENVLVKYFKHLGELDKLPSVNTVDAKKSHIKCKIYDLTDGKVDIFNPAKFPKFRRIYNALKRKIVSSGKSWDGNSDGTVHYIKSPIYQLTKSLGLLNH